MNPAPGPRFGPFALDRERLVLWRGGEIVPLQLLPTRVLLHMVERAGQVVTRDELREAIWDRVYLGFDDRLNTCIASIRSALGDSASDPRYIETLRGRGYRFIAEVGQASGAVTAAGTDAPPSPESTREPARAVRGLGLQWALVGAVAALGLFTVRAPLEQSRRVNSPLAIDADVAPEAWEPYVRAWPLVRSGRRSDLVRAGELLDRAVRVEPGFAEAQAARAAVNAMLYGAVGDRALRAAAQEALDAVTTLEPDGPQAAWGRGMAALYADRSYVKAAALLDTAARAWPDDPDVLNARAEAARRMRDWRQSNRYFETALEVDPLNAVAAAGLAVNHHRLRDFDGANRYYSLAMALSPDRPELAMQRARLGLRHGGTHAEAIEVLKEHAPDTRLPPRYAVHMASDLARILGPHVDWREADSLRVGPADRGIFNLNRAWMALSEGHVAEADELLRRAVVYFGGDPDVAPDPAKGILRQPAWLGVAWALLGKDAEARAHAEVQLSHNPAGGDGIFDPYVRLIVAETFVTLGEDDRAAALLEELLAGPSGVTPRQLLLDPIWKPLYGHPVFEKLVRSAR